MLTADEHKALALTAELHNLMATEIMGHGPVRQFDLAEWVMLIHLVQRMIMAQSAAREHPEEYRLLGELIGSPVSTTYDSRKL